MRIPIIAAILSFVFSIGIDLLIYYQIRRYSRHRNGARAYMVTAVLCWVYLAVVLMLPRRGDESGILHIMWMLYGYITVYASKLVYILLSGIINIGANICRRFSGNRNHYLAQGGPDSRRQRNVGFWCGFPLAVVLFGLMWWGAGQGRSQIEVTQVVFESSRLPEAFDGYKIVQFSDAHVGTWGSDTRFIKKLVDSINAQHPDMIVFTGDIVNRETSEIMPFINVLSRLKAPDGVYSVLGNHDYGDYRDWDTEYAHKANNDLLVGIEEQMGWKMLNNDHSFVVRRRDGSPAAPLDSLVLIGVENWGEPPFKQYGSLGKAYPLSSDSDKNVNDHRFKLLLTHNPEHWRQEVSQNTNIDLSLSGHTHAMQIVVSLGDWRWSPSKWRYEEWGGMYTKPNKRGEITNVYVNIGCGEVGMPFRIGATPEVTVITLRCATSSGTKADKR